MTMHAILASAIESERDVVLARRRAWQLAEQLGFDAQDRTRIATSVSEIARNAFTYAGRGRVEFAVDNGTSSQLVIVVTDTGGGIASLEDVLHGRYTSTTGMGLGIVGARRLMDEFRIDTSGAGTSVRMAKRIPPRSTPVVPQRIGAIAAELARSTSLDPDEEVHRQNRELLTMLQEVGRRQEELSQLNQELEDTNRGVVALYAELDEKAERLRQADEIKSRFLSHMSHEFRTPLSSILALARLLLDRTDGELSPEQEKQVTYIKRSAQELSELVNDLLDLAKVEAGKTSLTIESFSLESLFGALRGVMKPLVPNDHVALTFNVPPAPVTITSDEAKISQILRNLISNALKFTERGEVSVDATMADEGATVVFAVTDTGIGIAPEEVDVIFEEFGQINNAVQQRVKGTGLGLPLSRRLAELLGGSLSVSSRAGAGSCFTLTLPVALERQGGAPASDIGCRVLIVDDEVPPRYLLRRLLEEQGCAVIEATCGVDGVRIATERRPDLILLDFIMPDLNGLEVAARLRRNSDSADIPICLVTSKVLTPEERSELDRRSIPIVAKESLSRTVIQSLLRQRQVRGASYSSRL